MGSSQSSTGQLYFSSSSSTSLFSHCSHAPPASKIYYTKNGNGYYRFGRDGYIPMRPGDDLRVSFDATQGASVKCFPSKGGVYEHHCSTMELDFLGLPRFDTLPPSSDPEEEDALCAKLLHLGAEWWPSLPAKYAYEGAMNYPPGSGPEPPPGVNSLRHEKKIYFFAVTSEGGLWALAVDKEEGTKKGLGRIENSANMEEKYKQMEKLGGVFYANPRDCRFLDFRGVDGLPTSDDELDELERTMRHERISQGRGRNASDIGSSS
ncbi:hypothetical protein V8F33_000749 [Rhypophila sp. PSN 637]